MYVQQAPNSRLVLGCGEIQSGKSSLPPLLPAHPRLLPASGKQTGVGGEGVKERAASGNESLRTPSKHGV
jgi:hypothetical protein